MADIASSDVTYTETGRPRREGGRTVRQFTVAFGNGTLTYPSGGVPLNKAKLGCPNVIERMLVTGPASANGFVYKWDPVNEKLRIYQGDNDNAADAALIELVAATATPAAATLYVEVMGW